jgi:2-amino-4-hydroxy-6-hydroxymethyldihydropteridine diphosphokinase/dihydropteroate synthase
MAVKLETALSPEQLLITIKSIEEKIGRKKRGVWAPREVDIDILAFEGVTLTSDSLNLPHHGLLGRDFALLPFADIAPDWDLAGISAQELVRRKAYHLPVYEQPKTRLVGILNITPDSFSDGGLFMNADHAFTRALEMVEEGAVVVDIGAESTRPGATPLSHEEEWRRLEPVLNKLLGSPISISIDTRHPATARNAADMGVAWINDVSGFASPQMIEAVAGSECRLVVMHSLSIPADRSITMQSSDIIAELVAWADTQLGYLRSLGIAADRLIMDPGIGFGKTPEQNWQIVTRADVFKSLGVDVLMGHSRKSFLQVPADKRDEATLEVSQGLIRKQVQYLRVHDVTAHRALL